MSTPRPTVPIAGAVTLPARPENLPIDPKATALIVVDMQNAYASAGGYLDLAGFDIEGAAAVIDKIAVLVETAREAGVQVVFFQNGWDPNYVEAGGEGSPNWWKSNALKTMRDKPELKGTLLAKGTWDYALVDRLKPQTGDIVIEKPRYSAFYNTALDSMLRARGIRNLGLLRHRHQRLRGDARCATAITASTSACCWRTPPTRPGPAFLQEATVYNVEKFFGWVSNTADFCGAVGQAPPEA